MEIVALHDIAYPLMQRLQEAIPGVHFYGAPAADAAHDPLAIVVLRLGAPCALFQSLADGARYRLVGVGAGDGLYLPEARVRALGWERRLPAFAGWTLDENLPLTVDEPVVPTAPVSHRVMTAAVARVFFPGWSGRARIAGTVGTTTAGLWLDLSVNGGRRRGWSWRRPAPMTSSSRCPACPARTPWSCAARPARARPWISSG